MGTKNKARGNTAEYYVRDRCEHYGVNCDRAWGSDGRSMGLDYEDDGTIGRYRWQSKRFKFDNVVKWFYVNCMKYLTGDQDLVTFYIDRAKGHPRKVYAIMDLEDLLSLIAEAKNGQAKDS